MTYESPDQLLKNMTPAVPLSKDINFYHFLIFARHQKSLFALHDNIDLKPFKPHILCLCVCCLCVCVNVYTLLPLHYRENDRLFAFSLRPELL